jgi:hypothetical protein
MGLKDCRGLRTHRRYQVMTVMKINRWITCISASNTFIKFSLVKLKDEVVEKEHTFREQRSSSFSQGYGGKFGLQTDRVDKVD